jgi:branched-chain amino acid transport system ATP-binding protein
MLEVKGLAAGYQGNNVVSDISFHVNAGEAVMIIGSNGAGKTTLFRSMIGLLPLSAGQVRFERMDISGIPTHQTVRLGIGFVPAERHLFPRMTVEENLSLGAYPQQPDKKTLAVVMELFPRLAERKGQMARTMSGGEQQMLAVGRALMSKPRLLVLDEPSTGLAPLLARGTYKALSELRKLGLTVLVAEQQVPLAMGFSDRGYVLENGRIEIEGTSAELGANPDVRRAYLGVT